MRVYPAIKWGLIGGGTFIGLLVAAFVVLVVYDLHAQQVYATMPDSHDLKQQISRMGADYLVSRQNGALVIAFYQRGRESFQGFGKKSAADAGSPDAKTIFEIGSMTKIFTATVLAEMVNDGAVKLDDPISRYLPTGVESPKSNRHEITLENLATHTSGLPRLPDNFFDISTNELNPYVNYTTKDLFADVSAIKLGNEPGKVSVYSNYGFGLLGKLLELKAGKSYEELIQQNVCAPLGLPDTTTQLSAKQRELLTPGHDGNGNVVPNWDFNALAGAGAIRSDTADILKFVEANLGHAGSRVSEALAKTQECHFKQLAGGVGLGWQITQTVQGQTVIWHNGGTGGYVSFMGFDKQSQVGVVILSNYADGASGDHSVDEMGMDLLRIGSKVSLE